MMLNHGEGYKMLKKRANKKIIFNILILLGLYVIYTTYSIISYSQVDDKRRCDVAMVLGAATWDNEPSPVFRERINHGIWLYQNGYVNTLIFTGGKGEGKRFSESGIAKIYAIEQGVKEEDILIEEASSITQENIANGASLMQEHRLHGAIIVSDPLHMKRAMLMARDVGIDAYPSPTPTTRYRFIKSKLFFLGREVFYYIGYRVYRLLY